MALLADEDRQDQVKYNCPDEEVEKAAYQGRVDSSGLIASRSGSRRVSPHSQDGSYI